MLRSSLTWFLVVITLLWSGHQTFAKVEAIRGGGEVDGRWILTGVIGFMRVAVTATDSVIVDNDGHL